MPLLISKYIYFLGISAFLTVSFWSLFAMSISINGNMLNCPFIQNSSSLCRMNIAEHISAWQQFSTSLKENNVLLALFSLLVVCVVAWITEGRKEENIQFQKFRCYFYKHRPEIKLFNPLALAFAQGIINPKIYA